MQEAMSKQISDKCEEMREMLEATIDRVAKMIGTMADNFEGLTSHVSDVEGALD